MRGILISIVVLAGCAPAAMGQVPRGYAPVTAEQQRAATEDTGQRFGQGVAALQSKNYKVAESLFREVLRVEPNHPDANFMLGVTLMSTDQWEEARKYLEIAVRKKPKEPDPKSRLGVTLVKLGDIDGANKQRADLVKLGDACKNKCRNAEYITNGIAMIDQALAPPPS